MSSTPPFSPADGNTIVILYHEFPGNTDGASVSEVVSFKVRRELKEKMRRYRGVVNWSEELRRFLEEKIRELKAEESSREVLEELKEARWSVPKGFAAESVRGEP